MMEKQASSESFVKALWNAYAEPAVRDWVKSVDPEMTLGPWQPHGSLLDHLEEREFNGIQNKIMETASGRDPETIKLLKGFNTMLGGEDWTPDQQAQAETIRGGISKAAPFLMRWAPDWWDEMHGSTGSQASLANAIAESNRYNPDFTAEMALAQADQMSEQLLADPTTHRGFSLKEIGDIYRESAKRGLINRGSDAPTLVNGLTPIIGATSAVRDTMGAQGYDTHDIGGMFNAMDTVAPAAHYDFNMTEQNIRRGDYFRRQGGMFNAAMNSAGQTAADAGVPMATLEAQNRQLTEQAGKSHTGNLLAATARARDAGMIKEDSPAAKFLDDAMAGKMQNFNDSQWRQLMSQSGVDMGMAMVLASQTGENQQFMATTPRYAQLPNTVRMNQTAFDHQRQFDMIDQRFKGSPHADTLAAGAKGEYVRGKGYKNGMKQYNSLHGDAAKNLGKVWDDADNRARVASNWSHLGHGGPVARTIDGIKDGTQSAKALTLKTLGGVRVPKGLHAPKTAELKVRGLPDRNDFGDTGDLPEDEIADLFVQNHKARKAGEHIDLRIGNKDTGLYSWASKPPSLPKPGKKQFMKQQPIHTHQYGSFSGSIGSGHRKGEVRNIQTSKVLITKSSPTRIEYTMNSGDSPERYILMKPAGWQDRNWLLINRTKSGQVNYKNIPAEAVAPVLKQLRDRHRAGFAVTW